MVDEKSIVHLNNVKSRVQSKIDRYENTLPSSPSDSHPVPLWSRIFCRKGIPYVTFPLDGIALLNWIQVKGGTNWVTLKTICGLDHEKLDVATVEIVTSIAASSINKMEWFARLRTYLSLFIFEITRIDPTCSSLPSTKSVFCADCQLSDLCLCFENKNYLHSSSTSRDFVTKYCVSCTYNEVVILHDFCIRRRLDNSIICASTLKGINISQWILWKLLNGHVYGHGPLSPLQIISNGCQVLYSKLKCASTGFQKFINSCDRNFSFKK